MEIYWGDLKKCGVLLFIYILGCLFCAKILLIFFGHVNLSLKLHQILKQLLLCICLVSLDQAHLWKQIGKVLFESVS